MNKSAELWPYSIAGAFSRQAPGFDAIDAQNDMLQYMRNTVRQHVLKIWKKGDHILELNCGTGLDAVFFAQKGFNVYATDNAEGMLQQAEKKISDNYLEKIITLQNCSFDNLNTLSPKKFDHIFSNFGGLNCTGDLQSVIEQFNSLLNPNATVTLVLMPPICPWEIALALKGNFRTAFRRLNKKGANSQVEGIQFTTWYYSPTKVQAFFGKGYKRLYLQSLGFICPPPYMEEFPKTFPRLFSTLTTIEKKVATLPLLRNLGDHFIITMQKA